MKYSKRGGMLRGIGLGIVLCLLGLGILVYVSRDILLEVIRESRTTTAPSTTSQPSSPEAIPGSEQLPENTPLPDGSIPNVQQGPSGSITTGPVDSNVAIPNIDSAVFGKSGKGHLTPVPQQFTSKSEYVHKSVYAPLMALIQAARNDNINLRLVSAYRSYDHQKQIWERKWGDSPATQTSKAFSILSYSSFPGTSRHHWGTDVDFNSVSSDYWTGAEGRRVHQWLLSNGPLFGFCQVYAPGRNRGYSDEPWHWSHIPTAQAYYNQISQPAVLNTVLSQPVKGAEAVRQMPGEIMGYITGISGCSPSSANTRTQYQASAVYDDPIPQRRDRPSQLHKLGPGLYPDQQVIQSAKPAPTTRQNLNADADFNPVYSDDVPAQEFNRNPKPPLSDADPAIGRQALNSDPSSKRGIYVQPQEGGSIMITNSH